MPCVHTFDDGVELEADYDPSGYSISTLIAVMNVNTCHETHFYFDGQYVQIEGLRNNFIKVRLEGFTFNTSKIIKNGLATDSDKEQLDIAYKSAKDFIADMNDLPNLYIYAKECESFDNIVITRCHSGTVIISHNKETICSIELKAYDILPTQQECQEKIRELVDKLVIYKPNRMTKSARADLVE